MEKINQNALLRTTTYRIQKPFPAMSFQENSFLIPADPSPINALYWLLSVPLWELMAKQVTAGKWSPFLKCFSYCSHLSAFTEPRKTQFATRCSISSPTVSSWWWLILIFSMQGPLFPMNWGTRLLLWTMPWERMHDIVFPSCYLLVLKRFSAVYFSLKGAWLIHL